MIGDYYEKFGSHPVIKRWTYIKFLSWITRGSNFTKARIHIYEGKYLNEYLGYIEIT